MAELTEKAAVRRAIDRFGFGAGGATLAKAQSAGLAATLETLLEPPSGDAGVTGTPPPTLARLRRAGQGMGKRVLGEEAAKPSKEEKKKWRMLRREQEQKLGIWWLDRMVMAEHPVAERMTWFWHGHFATSNQKVKDANLMLGQNETMRRLGRGDFGPLAQAMAIDPAMLVWLDGNDNTAKAPNENLSREFLELFTLGHGHYTEDDVREAARALTGWKLDREKGAALFRPGLFDPGEKKILGQAGGVDAEAFVSLVVRQQSAAEFVISRLWFRLVSATPPSKEALGRLLTAFGERRNVTRLLVAMADEPAFRDTSSALVKQPVEWLVGLMRALQVRPSALEPKQQKKLTTTLRGMGQIPFYPPSVGGWPSGAGWLGTAAALSRMEAARSLAEAAEPDPGTYPARAADRVDYLRRLLGVDAFSSRTAAAIEQVGGRLPAAVAVAACSPEYTVTG